MEQYKLNFSNWLEATEKWGRLSWDGQRWYESSHLLHGTDKINAFWDNKKIDIDVGPKHSMLKRALKTLLKQRPEFSNLKIEFDGYSPGTVSGFINQSTRPPWEMPLYFYHGTSENRWNDIQNIGLTPRSETGITPAYGAHISSAKTSNPNYVYLTGFFGSTARLAAIDAANIDQSIPVILRIDSKGIDPQKLRADEDAIPKNDPLGNYDWQYSIQNLDTVGYEGSISPQFIKLYKTHLDRKWVDPIPPKPDWLAKQIQNIGGSGYKDLPDTISAKYKWINPRD